MFYFLNILLCTLVLRLHITFKDTACRMSNTTYTVFILILTINFIVTPASYLVVIIGKVDLPWIFISVLLLHFIASVMAVSLFLRKLSQIAIQRTTSPRNIPNSASEVSLDRQQMKLSNLAARYLGLFVIANVSTFAAWLGFGLSDDFIFIFILDFTVNLLCLYLQFPSSKHHYHRLCGCCDKGFRAITRRRTQRLVYNHSFGSSTDFSLQKVASPSSPSAMSEVNTPSGNGQNTIGTQQQ